MARGKLADGGLENLEVIFRQEPKVGGGNHFGSRLAFAPHGKLFITLGERFTFTPAQDLSNDLGKIVRINPDGSVPDDNPFVGQKGARPEIWSYGHRNPQGAAINPSSGKLWESEFGPWGGDELNIPQAGRNYGWPVVSWGKHYDGTRIPAPPTHPEFADAIAHWTPVISPSGIAFYTGELDPRLEGQPPYRRPVVRGAGAAHPRRGDGEGRGAHPHGHSHPRRGAGSRRFGLPPE